MSRIIRSLSSDIVIPFHAWEPRNSSHNGRKSKGITAESLQGGPAVSPHNLLRPLPPSRGEAASSNRPKRGKITRFTGKGYVTGYGTTPLLSCGCVNHREMSSQRQEPQPSIE